MSVVTLVRAVVAVVVRPSLWSTAVRQVFVQAPDGWWRRAPFVPVPDRAYLRFRLQTMYGDPDHAPEPEHHSPVESGPGQAIQPARHLGRDRPCRNIRGHRSLLSSRPEYPPDAK